MAVSVTFTHDIEELGITLEVEASVSKGNNVPSNDPDCIDDELEDLSIQLVGDPDNVELDDLSDVYTTHTIRTLVWGKDRHPLDARTGEVWPYGQPSMMLPRRSSFKKHEADAQGREYVRHLRSIQEVIEERVMEEASHEYDGPDTDPQDD